MNRQTLRWVIFGGLFLIPFIPFLVSGSLFFPFITTKAFAFRIIVEIVLASWVILALLDADYRPRRSPVLWAVFAFLLVIGAANLLGAEPSKSFWSNFERMEGYVTLLHLGALFVVLSSVFRETDWRRWWNTSLAASGLMVLYCLLQLAGSIKVNQGGTRLDGTFGNATYLAVYMLFHFFVALLFLVRAKVKSGAWWAYGILAIMHLVILYNTATRGAMLGVMGGLFVLAVLNLFNKEDARLKNISIGILATLVVLVGGFWLARSSNFVQESPVLVRFANITTTELQGGGRSFVWPMAVEGIKERPILGWGQENFNYVFQEHYDADMYNLEPWFDRAHNIFLDWGIAGGIFGLAAYLSLYVTLLYMVWKRSGLAYGEKSIITALVAAYFFHNIFVFDHLVSYILFFALLAEVASLAGGKVLWNKEVSQNRVNTVALPAVLLALILVIYFVNIRPFSTNTNLLAALRDIQFNAPASAATNFREAYSGSYLGKRETAEQLASNSLNILRSSMPAPERDAFYLFTKDAVTAQAEELSRDARFQLVAGSYLGRTGQFAEATSYLTRAEELIPTKPAVYLELGTVYLNQSKFEPALAEFEKAYAMAPGYTEAQAIYLIGAIYAGDRALEEKLIREMDENIYITDDRIVAAYVENDRKNEAIALIEKRMQLDPANAATYQALIDQIRRTE